jgi:hypothetical protein
MSALGFKKIAPWQFLFEDELYESGIMWEHSRDKLIRIYKLLCHTLQRSTGPNRSE